jgi:hypothetical protein
MSFRVVCISRSLGARGEEIGRLVAHKLSFRYVDEEIINAAAMKAQVDPAVVAASEHRQPLLQRLIDRLPTTIDLAAALIPGAGAPLGSIDEGVLRAQPEDMRIFIRAAIHEVGRLGDSVIVAHAASMALAGVEGVLRVLVTASPEVRSGRIAATQNLAERAAADAVAHSDRERRQYFQTFYKIKEELPTHYDLTINTDALSPEQAANVVAAAVRGE